MSAENKPRPALRPAGNVTLPDSRAANTRKPTKKPPTSPPLKPSAALSVKISPPNSLPSTPRASLSKSPALAKPVSSPKLTPTKLSMPPANTKLSTSLGHEALHSLPLEAHPSPLSPSLPLLLHTPSSVDNSSVIHSAQGPCDHVVPAVITASDGKEIAHTTNTPLSTSADLDSTNGVNSSDFCDSIQLDSSHAPAAVSNAKTVACTESPAPRRRTKCNSSLSRSSSDKFQRGSTGHAKANGSYNSPGFIRIGSHSLDDAALAQLAAAKKAAACELSAQRKLKVLEYGRRPGKANRVAPEVVPSQAAVNAEPQRCKFITLQSDSLSVSYHDQEWGVPVHDDRSLFELLVLAGAQVELSWTTILQKRELYRNVFCGYDPSVVASFNEKHIKSLEADKTLLLQSGKIRGVVENARRVLEVVKEFGSFDTYLWSFLNYKPMINHYRYPKQLPAKTSKSEFISKDLVRRGFRFVGPTIIYSFMQCAGMTNDHLVQCFRHQACMIQMHSSQKDASEGKLGDHLGVELEVEHIDAACMDSEPLLQELKLQTQHLGQHFTHSEFVHIEAY